MSPENKFTKGQVIGIAVSAGLVGIAVAETINKFSGINSTDTTSLDPTPTNTSTPRPTETATPNPTLENVVMETTEPSPTPKNPYDLGEILLYDSEKLSFKINADKIKIKEDFKLVLYPDNLKTEEQKPFIESYFAPGANAGLLEIEKYGNLVLYLHSGYTDSKKNEAEDLRHFLEGGYYFADKNADQVASQMQYLEDQTFEISGDEDIKEYEVFAVTQIPHDKIPEYDKNTKNAIDVITEVDPVFEYFKENPNGILISFCGWGPEGYKEHDRYSYSRFVIGLKPVN